MQAMQSLSSDDVHEDRFPHGYGRFGYEVTNPIPCNTVLGSMSYLSSLRTLEGESMKNDRIGSTSADISDMPIDMYRISDEEDREIAILYVSPYQKRNSSLAPEGFKLIHQNSRKVFSYWPVHLPVPGTTDKWLFRFCGWASHTCLKTRQVRCCDCQRSGNRQVIAV